LKEMYDAAAPAQGYDRWIELETGVTYTGGLLIGRTFNRITAEFEGFGENVRIQGNGAVIDLEGQELCISYCDERLDIDDCVILNGNIRFRGVSGGVDEQPEGSVRFVTFYEPHDFAVRCFGSGEGILIERNLAVGTVSTGPDFMYINGTMNAWLPTGANFAASAFTGIYGFPDVLENWSYHPDPTANDDPMRHFALVCEYG